jgi:hypothetical protein
MKKLSFILFFTISLFCNTFATITGPAYVDPIQSETYYIDPVGCLTGYYSWSVSGPAIIVGSGNGPTCTIKANNSSVTTCNIVLTVIYHYAVCGVSGNTEYSISESINIRRCAFMTGPKIVYPGDNSTYTVQDPCENQFYCTYDWSATIGGNNYASILSWNLNNVNVSWPTVITGGALSTGIIGHVRCYMSCSFGGYTWYTSDYPVYMKLRTPSFISGKTSLGNCDLDPITYSTDPVVGATYYQWTLPSGWSGSSTTTNITVYPNGLNTGVISVKAFAANGSAICSDARSLNIASTIITYPFTFISPSKSVYCISNEPTGNFSVTAVPNADHYLWTYPAGWSGPASTTINSTVVNFNGITQTATISCKAFIYCPTPPGTKGYHWGPQTSFQATTLADILNAPTYYSTNDPSVCVFNSVYWHINPVPTATSYVWSTTSTGASLSPNGRSCEIFITGSGAKYIKVQAINQCASSSLNTGILGIETVGLCDPLRISSSVNSNIEDFNINKISVFPNPVSQNLLINISSIESKSYTIILYNILGEKITSITKALEAGENQADIDMSNLKDGVYFLNIDNGTHIQKEKIVVSH